MAQLTSLGRDTIIISWVFTAFAFTSLVLGTAGRLHARAPIAVTEWLNHVAFIVGVVLVAQNTFTILVEGQAEHQSQLRDSQIKKLANVCHGL